MVDVETIKSEILETLHGINKDNLSIYDLKTYAEILKITSEAQDKKYFDTLVEKFSSLSSQPYPGSKTISEMKGDATNGV